MNKADRPTAADNPNVEYHTHTGPDDVAPICIIGGAPGRMQAMAEKYLTDFICYNNEHRGILTFTGLYQGVRVSLSTSGMGVPYMGIVLPELIRSGARIFIRVGSCGSLIKYSRPGDAIIVDQSRGWDGVSPQWVPWWRRFWHRVVGMKSDPVVTGALFQAGVAMASAFRKQVFVGKQGTTSDFYTGQARPGLFGEVPLFQRLRHWFSMKTGHIQCYSMEMAGLLAFCRYKAGRLPASGIEAVFANRWNNEFGVEGEDLIARIALAAAVILAHDERMERFMTGDYPRYWKAA
jgi:uridine phosphorylase